MTAEPQRKAAEKSRGESRHRLGHPVRPHLYHLCAHVVRAVHHVEQRIHALGEKRRRLENADDRHRTVVERELFADDCRVTAEAFHPALVREHGHWSRARPVVGRQR